MDRKTAAVIREYGTEDNEFLYIIGNKIEFKKLELETPAGLISMDKKEVREVFEKAVSEKMMFTDKSKQRLCELLSHKAEYLSEIEEPDEDMQLAAIRHSAWYIRNIKNPSKRVKREALLRTDYSAVTMGYGRQDMDEFRDFTTDEIIEIVKEKPASMSGIPTELITGNIVYSFLEAMVKQNLPYLYGAFCNIPDEFKDKIYWQSMCMVNGYNYSGIPDEKKEEYISSKLIHYTLDNQNSFIGTMWLYEYIPEKFKTEEISIKCIRKHFGCVNYLPASLNNEAFLEKLVMDESENGGQFSWVQYIDMKNVSKELFRKLITKYHLTRIPEKVPASYINDEVAIVIAENTNNDIPKVAMTDRFFDAMAEKGLAGRIPENKMTEERALKLAESRKYKVLEKIPGKFKTKEFMDKVLNEKLYRYIKDINDYLTEEIVIEAIQNGMVTRFDEIPKEFQSKRTAEALVEKNVKWIEIPPEYQTEKICACMLSKCDSSKYEWMYCLKHCSYPPKSDIDKALELFSEAIDLPGLTREQIDRSLEKFPMNILKVPEWYLNGDDTKEKEKPSKSEIPEYTECKQMSIFDILGI